MVVGAFCPNSILRFGGFIQTACTGIYGIITAKRLLYVNSMIVAYAAWPIIPQKLCFYGIILLYFPIACIYPKD